jgi:thiol-disulfide isomerase/thioredoxin
VRILNKLASAFPAIAMAAVVLGLSVQLVRAKQANAALAGEVNGGIEHFVNGAQLGELAVQAATGTGTLRGSCGLKRGTVVYISSATCPFCAKIAPELNALAAARKDLQVTNVVVQGTHADGLKAPASVVTAAPAAVAEALHVRVVPAVVGVDSACRIRAAGAGYNASRAVLQYVSRPPT